VSNEWTLYITELKQGPARKYGIVPPQMVYTLLNKLVNTLLLIVATVHAVMYILYIFCYFEALYIRFIFPN